MTYAQPAQGDKLDLKSHGQEYLGKLFLIFPSRIMENVDTSQGVKDRVVVADVIIIDLPDPVTGQPTEFHEAWLFGTVLVNQTAPEVNGRVGKVLGRLTQGANTKGNPPWMLADFTPQDAQLAEQYEATHPRGQAAQPSGAPPAGPPPQAANPWDTTAPPATQAPAAAWQPPAPAAAPTQIPAGQWQPPAAAAPALDPNLAKFLTDRGVNIAGMDDATARQIAASFPS